MKRVLLIGIALIFAQWTNAQTPCEKMFSKAKNYYEAKDYSNAKAQFQKVVNNCDSNKDIAIEYINLCNGWIGVKEKELNNNNSAVVDSQIKNLQKENTRLIKENEVLLQQNQNFKGDNLFLVKECQQKEATIDSLINKELRPCENTIASIDNSIREMGKELNDCLEKKLSSKKKQQIIACDTITGTSSLVDAMRKNLKLLTN